MAKKGKKRCDQQPVLHPDAAGIDVGASELFAAVAADRDSQPVRSFPTSTRDRRHGPGLPCHGYSVAPPGGDQGLGGAVQRTLRTGSEVIASLNHPNICQLYDVGPNYLVMALVEGPTLADRIRQGNLPVDEALAIARQIAEAVEAAHEKGKVHRDLKPSNVKITPEGVVKVLDFGLAPTQTMPPTGSGVILGTVAYMSPEQARGAAVDKRADIWAFGCVLYEMLSGKPAFQGETTSDILAAVLNEEPDWNRIPVRMQPFLRHCLMNDPKHRLRDIGDTMLLVDSVPDQALTRPLQSVVRVSVELSPRATLSRSKDGQVALSTDGTRIAIVEQVAAAEFRLATLRLDEIELVPLSGTEGARMPFFSPAGQWIGFFADGKLKKIAVQGGAASRSARHHTPRAQVGVTMATSSRH